MHFFLNLLETTVASSGQTLMLCLRFMLIRVKLFRLSLSQFSLITNETIVSCCVVIRFMTKSYHFAYINLFG